jgi:TonB family protein
LESGQQGTVVLTLTGDDSGHVVSVDTKTSSGSPVLDRATVDFIKRHWRLPTDSRTRLFETSITYKLLLN